MSDSTSIPAAIPPVAGHRRAVIDVGTNSVKLLVGDVQGGVVQPRYETSQQTRLGQGFYESHVLRPDAIVRTARVVAHMLAEARAWQVESIRVLATSAARDARNGGDLITAIYETAGQPLEVISGEHEADLAFRGVTSAPELAGESLLVLDVGGGSTEFIVGHAGEQRFRQSFAMGSVRLLEKLPHSDPPTATELADCRTAVRELFAREIIPVISGPLAGLPRRAHLVGTGGAATILVRIHGRMTGFDRVEIESARLSRAEVTAHLEHLWSLPLAERRQIIGLPPERADVILTGVAIYAAVLEELGFDELRTSTRGLRFAALLDGASA